MGMNAVTEALLAHLNLFREHLDDATITLIDQLVETDEQPDELQQNVLYQAEQKLRRKLGDEEYLKRS